MVSCHSSWLPSIHSRFLHPNCLYKHASPPLCQGIPPHDGAVVWVPALFRGKPERSLHPPPLHQSGEVWELLVHLLDFPSRIVQPSSRWELPCAFSIYCSMVMEALWLWFSCSLRLYQLVKNINGREGFVISGKMLFIYLVPNKVQDTSVSIIALLYSDNCGLNFKFVIQKACTYLPSLSPKGSICQVIIPVADVSGSQVTLKCYN